jgi:DNA-binding transcriptional LysR family regulator
MRELNEIECFVKAVELKSLTAAAKALKLPTS